MNLHETIRVKLLCLEGHLVIDALAVQQVLILESELAEVVQELKILNSLPSAVST
jgi:hypothetical protein